MANSLTDVLIAVGAIALVALVIWLFETGRLRINERLSKVLKKIGVFILVAVGIAYLVAMVSFVTYKVATEGDLQGIMFWLSQPWHSAFHGISADGADGG